MVLAIAMLGPAADRRPMALDASLARVAGLPMFAGLPPARLEWALAHMHLVAVTAGQVVIRQGDQPDLFYVIDDGTVRCDADRRPGVSPRELRRMGATEVFGEIGLLHGVPRTATVTAATDGRLLALGGSDFLELVGYGPGLSSRLIDLYRGASGIRR